MEAITSRLSNTSMNRANALLGLGYTKIGEEIEDGQVLAWIYGKPGQVATFYLYTGEYGWMCNNNCEVELPDRLETSELFR